MKKILVTFLFVLFAIMCSGQTQKPYWVSWTDKPNTVGFVLATWEGAAPVDCPFYDNMPFADLVAAGLIVDTLYTTDISFPVDLNGEYINSIVFLAYDLSFGLGWVSNGTIGSFIFKPAILRSDALYNSLP